MSRLIAIMLGAVSCIAAAFINFYIQDFTTINVFSYTLFFVIPVGAILVGMVSNSGYYFSASITHRILDKYDFLAMACLAGAGMFLIYGLEYYYYVEKEGMGNIISFFQYLAYVTENSSYSVKFSKISLFTDIGSLGILGYCFLFVHFVGFIIGGAITFLLLFGADTCSKCSKYFRNKKKKTLFFSCVQDFNAYFAKVSEVDPDSNALQSTLFEGVTFFKPEK